MPLPDWCQSVVPVYFSSLLVTLSTFHSHQWVTGYQNQIQNRITFVNHSFIQWFPIFHFILFSVINSKLYDSSFERFNRIPNQYLNYHLIMDEVYEFFKNFFPAGFLLTFPIVFLIVPIQYSSASNEFSAYRMQQFNFYGVSHGKECYICSIFACKIPI